MGVSSNEYKIMLLLWNEGRPLTREEILKGTEGRNWNPASIHQILNSMISKGVIRITDEEKKYKRTYEARGIGRLLDNVISESKGEMK